MSLILQLLQLSWTDRDRWSCRVREREWQSQVNLRLSELCILIWQPTDHMQKHGWTERHTYNTLIIVAWAVSREMKQEGQTKWTCFLKLLTAVSCCDLTSLTNLTDCKITDVTSQSHTDHLYWLNIVRPYSNFEPLQDKLTLISMSFWMTCAFLWETSLHFKGRVLRLLVVSMLI